MELSELISCVCKIEGTELDFVPDKNSDKTILFCFEIAKKYDCFPFKSIGFGWAVNVPGLPSNECELCAILLGAIRINTEQDECDFLDD